MGTSKKRRRHDVDDDGDGDGTTVFTDMDYDKLRTNLDTSCVTDLVPDWSEADHCALLEVYCAFQKKHSENPDYDGTIEHVPGVPKKIERGGGPRFDASHPTWVRTFYPTYKQAPLHSMYAATEDVRGLQKSDPPDDAKEVLAAIEKLNSGEYDEAAHKGVGDVEIGDDDANRPTDDDDYADDGDGDGDDDDSGDDGGESSQLYNRKRSKRNKDVHPLVVPNWKAGYAETGDLREVANMTLRVLQQVHADHDIKFLDVGCGSSPVVLIQALLGMGALVCDGVEYDPIRAGHADASLCWWKNQLKAQGGGCAKLATIIEDRVHVYLGALQHFPAPFWNQYSVVYSSDYLFDECVMRDLVSKVHASRSVRVVVSTNPQHHKLYNTSTITHLLDEAHAVPCFMVRQKDFAAVSRDGMEVATLAPHIHIFQAGDAGERGCSRPAFVYLHIYNLVRAPPIGGAATVEDAFVARLRQFDGKANNDA
jgi:hypothetical protein